MNELYVSYAQAVALRECGFDWECNRYYSKEDAADGTVWEYPNPTYENFNDGSFGSRSVSAPTQALAQKWLREEKGVAIYVIPHYRNGYEVAAKRLGNTPLDTIFIFDLWDSKKPYPTYEAALSAGIDVALGLIRQK